MASQIFHGGFKGVKYLRLSDGDLHGKTSGARRGRGFFKKKKRPGGEGQNKTNKTNRRKKNKKRSRFYDGVGGAAKRISQKRRRDASSSIKRGERNKTPSSQRFVGAKQEEKGEGWGRGVAGGQREKPPGANTSQYWRWWAGLAGERASEGGRERKALVT